MALIELEVYQEVATDFQVIYLMIDIEYIRVVAVALHLIEALIVAGTPRGSYRSPCNIFNVDIEYIRVIAVALHLIEALIEVQVHQEVATDLQVTYLMWI